MTPRRLLVTEDDAGLARALARLLRSYGHDVYVASSCAEARLATDRFSLGVFDIELPDGNGVTLAAELLESGRVKRAVFFTGAEDPSSLRDATALGPVVTKARGVAVLRIAIENQLELDAARAVGDPSRHRQTSSTAPPPSAVKKRR